MTKYVRVQNADMASYKVKVDIQDFDHAKNEWVTAKTIDLDHPTDMCNEFLTGTRRFIIREAPDERKTWMLVERNAQ